MTARSRRIRGTWAVTQAASAGQWRRILGRRVWAVPPTVKGLLVTVAVQCRQARTGAEVPSVSMTATPLGGPS